MGVVTKNACIRTLNLAVGLEALSWVSLKVYDLPVTTCCAAVWPVFYATPNLVERQLWTVIVRWRVKWRRQEARTRDVLRSVYEQQLTECQSGAIEICSA